MIPRFQIWNPTLFLVLFFVGLRLASPATATAGFALLAVYAFAGRRQAIHAMLVTWLFLMLNQDIAPPITGMTLLRYLVLFAAAGSVLLRSGFLKGSLRRSRVNLLTLILGGFIVFHSLIISPEPIVSILKAISWILAVTTSLAAWTGLSAEERERTAHETFMILVAVAIASFLSLSMPYAYMINDARLFRGILGHSQALGPMLAILAAWTMALLLQRTRWVLSGLLAATISMVVFSGARTALLAAVLGIAAATILTPVLSRQRLIKVAPSLRSGKFLLLPLLALLPVTVWSDSIFLTLGDFINKGREFDSLMAAYDDSRGGLIDSMLANVQRYPLTGIGFGIASDPSSMQVERMAGIPISAVVEKGVAPIAILEELGLPGALLTAAWLYAVVRSGAHSGLAQLAVLMTVIALNFGEATLFSPGGMGLLSIVLIGWVVASSRNRKQYRDPK